MRMLMITYEQIKNNENIRTYIAKADQTLATMGYTVLRTFYGQCTILLFLILRANIRIKQATILMDWL